MYKYRSKRMEPLLWSTSCTLVQFTKSLCMQRKQFDLNSLYSFISLLNWCSFINAFGISHSSNQKYTVRETKKREWKVILNGIQHIYSYVHAFIYIYFFEIINFICCIIIVRLDPAGASYIYVCVYCINYYGMPCCSTTGTVQRNAIMNTYACVYAYMCMCS